MSPVPSQVTIDVINHLVLEASMRPLYPLELMKLKKAAESILDAIPATAHSVFGVVACLQGDEKKMRHEHELSIKLNPSDSNILKNYSRSLFEHGYVSEAIPYLVKSVELAPEDLDNIDVLLRYAYLDDDTGIIEKWSPEYKKRAGHPHVVESWVAEDKEDLAMLDETEVNIEECIPWETLKEELGL